MLKHIYLILVATFLFGFVAGFLLWLFNHTGGGVDDSPKVNNIEFSIIVNEGGGCELGRCASYYITKDGHYIYLIRPRNAEEIRIEGDLSSSEKQKLTNLLNDTEYERIEKKKFTGTCPIAYDGPAYQYEVIIGEEKFLFDSCRQDLKEEPLFDLLNQYFRLFQNQDRNT